MEDKQIIDLLFARDEQGLVYTEAKYDALYRSILRQALSDPLDIDEGANDVLLGIWNSIPPNFPNHFPSYICRIARRIGINRFKYNTRKKRNTECDILLSELEGCIPAPDRLQARQETMHLRHLLNTFLQGLDPQTRVLFLRRYYYLESVKSLADRFGVSANYVSVRLHRARTALRTLLEEEGVEL